MLVGRGRELDLLARRLEEGRPIAVVGEAGIGKTALLRVAVGRAERRAYEGGGLSTLSWMSYLPLERALGRRPLEGDPTHIADEIALEVRDGVLLVDDLQWVDVGTLRALELLSGRVALLTAVRRGDRGTADALTALANAHFELLPLEPLADADATEIVRTRSPKLSAATVARIVDRARGNPLLLEELSTDGGPTETLRLSLAARLRGLSPSARESMTRFAVAGRPLDVEVAGGGLGELLEAGLVEERAGSYQVRHALFAEVLEGELNDAERRKAHSTLARGTRDDGTAARHHAEAGERAEAYERALRAAATTTRPGERAAHLALAANVASEQAATDDLLLRAAAALTEARRPEEARELLDRVTSGEPEVRADAAVLRWRTEWDLHGSAEDLRAAVDDGLSAVAGSRTELEVRLRILDARTEGTYGGDHERFRAKAETALALAKELGVVEGYAHSVLGSALMLSADDNWDVHVSQAIELARRDGDVLAEFTATNTYVFGQFLAGDPAASLATSRAGIERASRLRLGAWQRRFYVWSVVLLWSLGDLNAAREAADELLSERLPPGDIDVLLPYACHVLVDLGLFDEANQVLARLRDRAAPDQESLGEALWTVGEVELWSGRPRAALAAADEYVKRFAGSNVSETPRFVELTRAWASFELGLDPPEEVFAQRYRLTHGSVAELAGLHALARGEAEAAAARFADARRSWTDRNTRSELRCAWAEGEALRRAGRVAAALVCLEEAERSASEKGFALLCARIERTLRQLGARRSAPRAAVGELSSREHEVLSLVAHGLSNSEIARRLGLSTATVTDHLGSATTKLGARTRAQAAALYSRL
jgi:DNA-binding CsgD family transcriptional regulator